MIPMFFNFLGRSVQRAWYLWIAAWLLLLIGTWYFAPSWNVVAQDKEFAFLPRDSPSIQAEETFKKAFPNDHLASSIVLVLSRTEDTPGHLEKDKTFIQDVLEPGLRDIANSEGGLADQPVTDTSNADPFATPAEPVKENLEHSIMATIHTPNAPVIGDLLVSPDHKALLVVVELTTEFLSRDNWPTIEHIEAYVRQLRQDGKLPAGTQLNVTGSAVIGRDHTQAELYSARSTTWLTVVLVVVLLVLIYRAPLLAFIPLCTVFLAIQLALNVLAILSHYHWIILFQGLQIYITILAYGAGVDYCLFLTARYKEELDRGTSPQEGVARAVGDVGHALTASAATVICGIAMMAFARFGKFHEAGLAIPLGLFLVLCMTLTFSPALLRLAGHWAFWPQNTRKSDMAGRETETAPQSGFILSELGLAWERIGSYLLRRPGRIWLVTVVCMVPFALFAGVNYGRLSYDVIGDLPSNAPSVAGTQALQEHFPPGILGTSTVVLINRNVDFGKPRGRAVIEEVTDRLQAQKNELGLYDVRSLTAPLGFTTQADLKDHKETIREKARERYLGYLGANEDIVVTRLELVFKDNPFARNGFEDLDRCEQAMRDALPADVRADTSLAVVGTTASVRDLSHVMATDRVRIEVLVLASVFVILIVLLRSFVVPVYLLLSVLFSYYVTLGVTIGLFWMLDPHGFTGIDWKVAVFLFTILIAVGEDYNIFLMTRVHEEDRNYDPKKAVTHALTRTGPIISSCGIIMAGTFGSLLAGTLTEMKQLGFALAFGVLLDTFLVRPVLVPSFLILWRSSRLNPTHWFQKTSPGPGVTTQTGTRKTQTAS
jgi:putative drug exporter of the RND superfamily